MMIEGEVSTVYAQLTCILLVCLASLPFISVVVVVGWTEFSYAPLMAYQFTLNIVSREKLNCKLISHIDSLSIFHNYLCSCFGIEVVEGFMENY